MHSSAPSTNGAFDDVVEEVTLVAVVCCWCCESERFNVFLLELLFQLSLRMTDDTLVLLEVAAPLPLAPD